MNGYLVGRETAGAAPPIVGAVDDGIVPVASESFVATTEVQEIGRRALMYLEAGYPVHFSGPAGTGKTTLALHVASKLGRPVTLVHGDDEFGSADLLGTDQGYRKSKLVDNFIHSVMKTEEEMRTFWTDNRLTTACRHGETLIYDEFNRSRPEANNVLLSVLGERILDLPRLRQAGQGYLEVHPAFRAIFTSNPEEYAGVHKTQDALMDRMITIHLGHYTRDTEVAIAAARSGIDPAEAAVIVDVVRTLRSVGVNNHRPTVRASIAIGRILAARAGHAALEDPTFLTVCRDVLSIDTAKVTRAGESLITEKVEQVVRKICGARARPAARAGVNGDRAKERPCLPQ